MLLRRVKGRGWPHHENTYIFSTATRPPCRCPPPLQRQGAGVAVGKMCVFNGRPPSPVDPPAWPCSQVGIRARRSEAELKALNWESVFSPRPAFPRVPIGMAGAQQDTVLGESCQEQRRRHNGRLLPVVRLNEPQQHDDCGQWERRGSHHRSTRQQRRDVFASPKRANGPACVVQITHMAGQRRVVAAAAILSVTCVALKAFAEPVPESAYQVLLVMLAETAALVADPPRHWDGQVPTGRSSLPLLAGGHRDLEPKEPTEAWAHGIMNPCSTSGDDECSGRSP